MADELHVMPDGYDAAQHVSTPACPCGPTADGTDTETGADIWRHRNP